MNHTTLETRRRKHLLTDKMKALSAKALAQKIGYLRVGDFPDVIFESLPRLSFNPGRQIKSNNNLYIVRTGSVIIRHAHHEYFIKDLSPGVLFGNLPLLGQTLLGTEVIAGSEGVTLAVLDHQSAKRWITSNPILILKKLGPRLSSIETEHYRSQFQLSDSRVAGLLLDVAREGSRVEGLTHQDMGEMLGIYRETVTGSLNVMELDKIIEIRRMSIKILDKQALKELSEL